MNIYGTGKAGERRRKWAAEYAREQGLLVVAARRARDFPLAELLDAQKSMHLVAAQDRRRAQVKRRWPTVYARYVRAQLAFLKARGITELNGWVLPRGVDRWGMLTAADGTYIPSSQVDRAVNQLLEEEAAVA